MLKAENRNLIKCEKCAKALPLNSIAAWIWSNWKWNRFYEDMKIWGSIKCKSDKGNGQKYLLE